MGALVKSSKIAAEHMAELNDQKMDGPRNYTESALINITEACDRASDELRTFLNQLVPFLESDRYDYQLTTNSVVIDCGAYKGYFAAAIASRYGCRVFCFEPVPEFFEACYRRLGTHPGKVLNYAVGGENGTVEGGVSEDSSGLFSASTSRWSAGMITMDVALAKVGVDYVDLLKINIEGSEFALLEDMAKKNLIGHFKDIQVQFHPVVQDAQARYDALQKILAKTHHLTLYAGWQWQSWRRKE